MGVQLRTKKLSSGQLSFYLDIYHNKKRWYEFLDIHINQGRPDEQDKEKKRLAKEIRAKRENDLIVKNNGLVDKSKSKADFIAWYENYLKGRELNNRIYTATVSNLKIFTGDQGISFDNITVEWINQFTRHLLKRMKNSSARSYLYIIQMGLDEAVRAGIIVTNPMRKIPRHERVKSQPTFRNAYTFEELQTLADAPCDINPQYKQGYLFSCFTGLRWSDINPLRWSNIISKTIDGEEEWFIYFGQQKTRAIEYLPLSDQAVEILKARKGDAQANGIDSPYVFPTLKETNVQTCASYVRVRNNIKKWAKAAGLNPTQMNFHTGRHTFATNVLENSPDGDLWTVSKLLGHKSIQSTQIYAKVRDRRKKSAVKALPKLTMQINPAA